jgi:hypothetical protein
MGCKTIVTIPATPVAHRRVPARHGSQPRKMKMQKTASRPTMRVADTIRAVKPAAIRDPGRGGKAPAPPEENEVSVFQQPLQMLLIFLSTT